MSDINERHGVAIDVNINVTGATQGKQELDNFSKSADIMEQRAKAISGMTITGPKINMQGTVKQIEKATKQATKYIETNLETAFSRMQDAYGKAIAGDTKATRNFIGYYTSYLMQGGSKKSLDTEYINFAQRTTQAVQDMARTQAAVMQGFLTTQEQVIQSKEQELALEQKIANVRSKKLPTKQNQQEIQNAQNILALQEKQQQNHKENAEMVLQQIQLEQKLKSAVDATTAARLKGHKIESVREIKSMLDNLVKIGNSAAKQTMSYQDYKYGEDDFLRQDITKFPALASLQGNVPSTLGLDMDAWKQYLVDIQKNFKQIKAIASAVKNNNGYYKGTQYTQRDVEDYKTAVGSAWTRYITDMADHNFGQDYFTDPDLLQKDLQLLSNKMNKGFSNWVHQIAANVQKVYTNNQAVDKANEHLKKINAEVDAYYNKQYTNIARLVTASSGDKSFAIERILGWGHHGLYNWVDGDATLSHAGTQQMAEQIAAVLGINIPQVAQKAKGSTQQLPLLQDKSGQLSLDLGQKIAQASDAGITKQQELATAVENTNTQIQGQINLFDYLQQQQHNARTQQLLDSTLSDGVFLKQSGMASADAYAWTQALNDFQIQHGNFYTDENGNAAFNVGRVITDFKAITKAIMAADNIALTLKNDLKYISDTGARQAHQDAIKYWVDRGSQLYKTAMTVGVDEDYLAEQKQFKEARQQNIRERQLALSVANEKKYNQQQLQAAKTIARETEKQDKARLDAQKKAATATQKAQQQAQADAAKEAQAIADVNYQLGLKQEKLTNIQNLYKNNTQISQGEKDNLDREVQRITAAINAHKGSIDLSKETGHNLDNLITGFSAKVDTTLKQPSLALDAKKLANDISTAEGKLNSFARSMEQAGTSSKALDQKIGQLRESLKQVSSQKELGVWKSDFSNLKANVDKYPKTAQEIAEDKRIAANTTPPDDIIAKYDQIMGKIRQVTSLTNQLFKVQTESRSNPFADYSHSIDELQGKIQTLQSELHKMLSGDFVNANKDILGTDRIAKYTEAMTKMDMATNKLNSSQITEMQKAYFDLRTAENKLLSDTTLGKASAQTIDASLKNLNELEQRFKNTQSIVRQAFGDDTLAQALEPLKNAFDIQQFNTIANGVKNTGDAIAQFKQKIKGTGPVAQEAKAAFDSLAASYSTHVQGLSAAQTKLPNETPEAFTNRQQAYFNQLNAYPTMAKWLDNISAPYLNLEQQLNSMGSFKAANGNAMQYYETIQRLKIELVDLYRLAAQDPNKDYSSYLLAKQKEADMVKELASGGFFKKETRYGTLDESSFQQVTNLDQLDDAAQRYASSLGTIVKGSQEWSHNGKSVSYMIEDQNNQLTKVTATMQNNNAYMKTSFAGYSNMFGDFGKAFGGFAKQFASYYGGYQMFARFLREARQGLQVLKDYDAALTDISYSMDVSEEGLQTLGASAVNMAKDLSTSLQNTMGIYQIYANMNTSIQDIEETAKPTAILANLSGKDALTASDQIQGVLQQFNMLKDESADVAATSMHVVDVLDNIASNVSLDYVKGMKTITDAVEVSGAVANDAGLSYEQLAAVTAKVAERSREDGSTIGNAIKTIVTRLSKVGKMPSYADEVSNEELSNASESLNEIGIAVYNADGSFRELDTILTELREKWDGLTDAQQSNLAYNIAATRQTSKFKNILESWTESMELADMATVTSGNAEANQEKYEESYNGKMQKIATQWDAFWLHLYDSKATDAVLNVLISITGGIDKLAESLGGGTTAALLFMNAIAFKGKFGKTIGALMGFGDKKNLARLKSWSQNNFIIKWGYYHKEYYILA